MNELQVTTPFDCTPQHALTTIDRHRGPIVVDFDETLYLRNSTSEFLSAARPSLMAFLLVKLVDLFKPWRLTGGEAGRDAWRVRAILAFMPWSILRWRRLAARIMNDGVNRPLVDRLRRADVPVTVSTLGFSPIVGPMLDHAGLNGVGLVAMNPWRNSDSRRGKLALTEDAMGPDAVAESMVVTDSPTDIELLEASRVPLRVVWPEAELSEAFRHLYFPGRYLTRVKRPNSHYVRSKILREDVALWILSSVFIADNPIATVTGLVLLAVSFWAVYEAGYVDNDVVADRFEESPKLTEQFRRSGMVLPTWQPALWAVVTGALGIVVLRRSSGPSGLDFGRWALVLAVTYLAFRAYNRLDKQTRIHLFPLLQLARSAAFVVLVPVPVIASVAIGAQVMVRWVSYYVYRLGDGRWPGIDLALVRGIFYLIGALLVAGAEGWSEVFTTTAGTLLIWHLFLARRELPRALRLAHRIDRG